MLPPPHRRPLLSSSPVVFVTIALAAALHSDPALAQSAWPNLPNLSVPLCTATGLQEAPVATSDGSGGAIVAWRDQRSTLSAFAQRITLLGRIASGWPVDGAQLTPFSVFATLPLAIAPDGAGGAIVAWNDYRNGNHDIFAQHVTAAGTIAPGWAASGLSVCTDLAEQINVAMASDGAGGAIIAWQDKRPGNYDIYGVRITGSGTVGSGWTANGTPLCTQTGDQVDPTAVSDGAGGAIVAWSDGRGANTDIYAQRADATGGIPTGWNSAATGGNALCIQPGNQEFPKAAADGEGGAIVTWQDLRTGGADIYAQRVTGRGTPQWSPSGAPLSADPASQNFPVIIPDGAGGAYVAWTDYRNGNNDIFAQRVTHAGAPASGWAADGVALCTDLASQSNPALAADGSGGAFAVWIDTRGGIIAGTDLYAQRVMPSGALGPGWPGNGVPICNAVGSQDSHVAIPDGAMGAIVAWRDFRSGESDVHAQRIERLGYLGMPEPVIASVRDVPNDQGAKVKLSWYASYLDREPTSYVDQYWIFRSVAPNLASQGVARGARLTSDPSEAAEPGRAAILATGQGAETYFWEFLAYQQAYHSLDGYSYVAPTLTDSMDSYNPRTLFMVQARAGYSGPYYWNSPPDSGYSVDNVAPATPAPFVGSYGSNVTHLHWGKNTEPDLAGYRLYKGSAAMFVPGPGNQIAAQPDTGFMDSGFAGGYYKLSAVDIHGNESGYALLSPADIAGVPGSETHAGLWLGRPSPNPVRDGATLRFALPGAGRVTLGLYDLSGRQVRGLIRAVLPAGEHAALWDGRGASGRPAASGLYVIRLEAAGEVRTERIVVAR